MKLIKYYTASCTVCRMVEKPVQRAIGDLDYEKILINGNNDLGINAVPTFVLIDDEGNRKIICSGGNPTDIVKKIETMVKGIKNGR